MRGGGEGNVSSATCVVAISLIDALGEERGLTGEHRGPIERFVFSRCEQFVPNRLSRLKTS